MKKLIIASDSLKMAMGKLGQAISTKPVNPATSNIYARVTPGQLELITTNLEITIYFRLECESKETFDFLVPFHLLNKIVTINKHCPLEITAGKVVTIKGPDDSYDIKVSEKLADFPKLQELPKKSTFAIDNDILSSLLIAAATTGNPDPQPKFAHVCMELIAGKLTIASTDGGYMVYTKEFTIEYPETEELLISQKVLKALEGCDKANIYYHKKAIGFESGNITIVSTRTEDKYVTFRKVFPENWPGNLIVNRESLLDGLSKCSLSADQLHTTRVNLETKNCIALVADDGQVNINVTIPSMYSGDIKSVAINSEKLVKLLNQISSEEIYLAIHDASKSVVITSTEIGYKGMIMPIALNN